MFDKSQCSVAEPHLRLTSVSLLKKKDHTGLHFILVLPCTRGEVYLKSAIVFVVVFQVCKPTLSAKGEFKYNE